MGDLGQCAGLVVTVHHQHVVLDDECAVLFEQQQRLARVTHHHANDAVVHGVAGGDCVDVDFRLGQRVTHAREHAGSVFQKDGELFGDLHSSIPDFELQFED